MLPVNIIGWYHFQLVLCSKASGYIQTLSSFHLPCTLRTFILPSLSFLYKFNSETFLCTAIFYNFLLLFMLNPCSVYFVSSSTLKDWIGSISPDNPLFIFLNRTPSYDIFKVSRKNFIEIEERMESFSLEYNL